MKDVLGLTSDYAAQFLGISQAGNVNTGAFDPALRLDGAFGLWAAASPRS